MAATTTYTFADAILCLTLSDGRYSFDPKTLGLPPFNRVLRQLFVNPTITQWAHFTPGSFVPSVRASQHADNMFHLEGLNDEESDSVISYCRSLASMEEHRHAAIMTLNSCSSYNSRMLGTQSHRCFVKWTEILWNGLGKGSKNSTSLKSWLCSITKGDNNLVFGASTRILKHFIFKFIGDQVFPSKRDNNDWWTFNLDPDLKSSFEIVFGHIHLENYKNLSNFGQNNTHPQSLQRTDSVPEPLSRTKPSRVASPIEVEQHLNDGWAHLDVPRASSTTSQAASQATIVERTSSSLSTPKTEAQSASQRAPVEVNIVENDQPPPSSQRTLLPTSRSTTSQKPKALDTKTTISHGPPAEHATTSTGKRRRNGTKSPNLEDVAEIKPDPSPSKKRRGPGRSDEELMKIHFVAKKISDISESTPLPKSQPTIERTRKSDSPTMPIPTQEWKRKISNPTTSSSSSRLEPNAKSTESLDSSSARPTSGAKISTPIARPSSSQPQATTSQLPSGSNVLYSQPVSKTMPQKIPSFFAPTNLPSTSSTPSVSRVHPSRLGTGLPPQTVPLTPTPHPSISQLARKPSPSFSNIRDRPTSSLSSQANQKDKHVLVDAFEILLQSEPINNTDNRGDAATPSHYSTPHSTSEVLPSQENQHAPVEPLALFIRSPTNNADNSASLTSTSKALSKSGKIITPSDSLPQLVGITNLKSFPAFNALLSKLRHDYPSRFADLVGSFAKTDTGLSDTNREVESLEVSVEFIRNVVQCRQRQHLDRGGNIQNPRPSAVSPIPQSQPHSLGLNGRNPGSAIVTVQSNRTNPTLPEFEMSRELNGPNLGSTAGAAKAILDLTNATLSEFELRLLLDAEKLSTKASELRRGILENRLRDVSGLGPDSNPGNSVL